MRSLLAGCLLAMPVVVQAQEPVDYQVVHEIKDEAFKNSKISEDMFYLADLHGPRLTASANYRAAADWAVGRLKEFGIQNAAL